MTKDLPDFSAFAVESPNTHALPDVPGINTDRASLVEGLQDFVGSSDEFPDLQKHLKTSLEPQQEIRANASRDLPDFSEFATISVQQKAPAIQEETEKATFLEALDRGVDSTQNMLFSATEAAGELIGDQDLTTYGREGRIFNENELKAAKPKQEFQSIEDWGDFGQYLKELAGDQIPFMAGPIAGGVAGAAAGAPFGPYGIAIGSTIGAFVPSMVLGTGETQSAIKEKDPNAVEPGLAFAGGTAIGALDSILPGTVGKSVSKKLGLGSELVKRFGKDKAEAIATKALLKPVNDSMIKRTAKGAAIGMATESVTESVQEAISELTATYATDTDVDWKQLKHNMIEGAPGGFFMGGGIGGVTSAFAGKERQGEDQDGSSNEEIEQPVNGVDQQPPPIPPQNVVPQPPPIPGARTDTTPPPIPSQAQSGVAFPTATQVETATLPPALPNELEILRSQGWQDDAIAEMSPEERATEVDEIRRNRSKTLADDSPTAEPVADLVAQVRDLVDQKDSRKAVWVPPTSVAELEKNPSEQEELLGSGVPIENFDGKGGMLIAEDVRVAANAVEARDNGQDIQEVVGPLTGSGTGKPADGSIVVQQITPDGAVTRESLVREEDVAATTEEFTKDGRRVRVATPDAVVQRRSAEIAGGQEVEVEADHANSVEEGSENLDFSELASLTGARNEPAKVESAEDIEAAGTRAVEPTEAQAKAGNYQMGHVKLHGLDISIETPKGGTRRKTVDGKVEWEVPDMPAAYGYVKGTKGNDGDHVDVFIGDAVKSNRVFVIDQIDADTGKFDEHKAVLGVNSAEEAGTIYNQSFSDGKGPDRVGGITELSVSEFKDWVRDGKKTKALSDSGATQEETVAKKDDTATISEPTVSSEPATVSEDEIAPTTPPITTKPDQEEAPDPYAFSPLVVVAKKGEEGLRARLNEHGSADDILALAKAQNIGVDKGLTNKAEIVNAVIDGAQQRLRNRFDAAGGGETSVLAEDKPSNRRDRNERWDGDPLSDGEIDAIVANWEFVRDHSKRLKPQSLSQYLKGIGGIRDEDKDVSNIGGNEVVALINNNGMSLDDAAFAAWEAGYFPGDVTTRPGVDDFLNLLQQDLAGEAVVLHDELEYLEDERIAHEISEELNDYGVTTQKFRSEASLREYFGQERPARESEKRSEDNAQDTKDQGREGDQVPVEDIPFELSDVTKDAKSVTEITEEADKTGVEASESVTDDVTEVAEPDTKLTPVEAVRERLLETGFKDIREARAFVKDQGITGANKQIDEFIENAVVLAARKIIASGKNQNKIYDDLVALYDRQPNLSVRTSTSVAEQAYSTPMPLAYLSSRLAGVEAAASIYEPSAGNGALLIEADPTKQEVNANELNEKRSAVLEDQGFNVTNWDATEGRAPSNQDVVIMNPPFGAVRENNASKVFEVDGLNTTAIDHAIALKGLQSMKDDGAAVLILGGVKEQTEAARRKGYRGKAKREFYYKLYNNYNVTDHFTASGDLYKKQGAGWPVDIIVIKGRGKSELELPAAIPPAILETWDDLKGKLTDERFNTRASGRAGKPSDRSAEGIGQSETRDGGDIKDATRSGSERLSSRAKDVDTRVRSDDNNEQSKNVRDDSGPETRAKIERDRDAGRADKQLNSERKPLEKSKEKATSTVGKSQLPYKPSSKARSLDSLVPSNMAASTQTSLKIIAKEHGSVDELVADRLGYDRSELPDFLSAEQIDAVASAIHNTERGSAFIVGDQTGIGKGRVVASMIRYAIRNDMTPIFVTEKPDLYGDMFRDMKDVGLDDMLGRPPNVFMTNAGESIALDEAALEWEEQKRLARDNGEKAPKRKGHFLTSGSAAKQKKSMEEILAGSSEFDAVFTTYNQLNTVRGKETPRRQFISQLADRSFFVLDESHNAGGTGNKGWKKKNGTPPDRAELARDLVTRAKAVMYSSATYAKRPDVMDLYARTDMGKAVDDPKLLPALIQRGGVPMQQIVAKMLSESGQYIRRERSFDGVSYEVESVPVDDQMYEQFSDSVRAVFEFDLAFKKERDEIMQNKLDAIGSVKLKDGGIGEASANSIAFASVMHNIVAQMLLSIKASETADKAITSFEAGEKPIIALANTMESFVKDFAAESGVAVGGDLDVTFSDVLTRYLERTLRITVKSAGGETEHIDIPINSLPSDLQKKYANALEVIQSSDFSGLPVSPIDAIRNKLRSAGMSVHEVTGRSTMIDYATTVPKYVSRPKVEIGPSGKRKSIAAFNSGKLDALILNRSGSTGVSMHSSKDFKDQRPRRMILAQAEPNIDTHLQMLGRVHRTGQVVTPSYSQIAASLPAETRPTAVLMSKMASLNANTTGARKSVFTSDAVDFMNEYGDQVVFEVLSENPEFNKKLGDALKYDADKGVFLKEDAAKRVTGRLVLLKPKEQEDLLDQIQSAYKDEIARLDALGENALEAKSLDLQAKTLDVTPLRDKQGDGPFLDGTQIERVSIKASGRAMKPDEVVAGVAASLKMDKPLGDTYSALADLETIGREWFSGKSQDFNNRARDFIKSELKDVTAETRPKTRRRLEDGLKRFMETASIAHPGARVKLGMPAGDISGIVTKLERSGKAVNPVALSAWHATIAVPDAQRTYRLPLSKLFPPSTTKSDDESGATIAVSQHSHKTIADAFEAARKEGRETRYIVTGNILSGYEQVSGRGQIVNYTTEDGLEKSGVLMGRDFELEKFMNVRSVRLKSGKQVSEFLNQAPMAEVKSTDGYATLQVRNGRFVIETPAGRATGGRYFTDPNVREAIAPQEFQKAGGLMRVAVPDEKVVATVDALRQAGALFETKSSQDVAEKVVREAIGVVDKPEAKAKVGSEAKKITKFKSNVDGLKTKLGVKTRKRDFGNDDNLYAISGLPAVPEATNLSLLRKEVEAIKKGSRLSVVAKYVATFGADADAVVQTFEAAPEVDFDAASVTDLQTYIVALEDLQQIVTSRVQTGYQLTDDVLEIGDTLSEEIDSAQGQLDELRSEADEMLGSLEAISEQVNDRYDELSYERFGDDEAALEAYEEDLDSNDQETSARSRFVIRAVDGDTTSSALDIIRNDEAMTRQQLTEYKGRVDALVVKDVDKMGLDELREFMSPVFEASLFVESASNWIQALSEIASKKYDEVVNIAQSFNDEVILPKTVALEQVQDDLQDVVGNVEDALEQKVSGQSDDVKLAISMERDEKNRKFAEVAMRMGREFKVEKKTVDAIHSVIRENSHLIPEQTPAYAIESVRRVGEIFDVLTRDGVEKRWMAEATLVSADGETKTIKLPWHRIVGSRAFFDPNSRSVVFARFGVFDGFVPTVSGELAHEVTHAYEFLGYLPARLSSRLVRHSKKLRVLDTQLSTYLQMVGDPKAKSVENSTLLEAYKIVYSNHDDIVASLNKEYSAHLVELYHHNMLSDEEVAPVRDILDAIDSGAVAKGETHNGLKLGIGKNTNETTGKFKKAPIAVERKAVDQPYHSLREHIGSQNLERLAQMNDAVSITSLKPWSRPEPNTKILAFHGTSKNFNTFDKSKSQDFGVHFGTPDQASSIVKKEWRPGFRALTSRPIENARVFPVVINARNTLTLPDLRYWEPLDILKELDRLKIVVSENSRIRVSNLIKEGKKKDANQVVEKVLEDAGYNAIRYQNMGEGFGWSYIVWNKGTVTSATADAQLFSLLQSERAIDDLDFYSQALESAKGLKQAKGTPEQMLAQLKKAGVKDAEIEATGLREFLDGKKSVSRDEVVEHLESSGVDLHEEVYSSSGTHKEPAWARYSLEPSNPTYRESVLHLPNRTKEIAELEDKLNAIHNERDEIQGRVGEQMEGATKEELQRFDDISFEGIELQNRVIELRKSDYRSGHFSEPNAIAHIRSSIQKDTQGNDVFVVNELQSDWGQRLRKEGIATGSEERAKKVAKLQKQRNEVSRSVEELSGRFKWPSSISDMDAIERALEVRRLRRVELSKLDDELKKAVDKAVLKKKWPGHPGVYRDEPEAHEIINEMSRYANNKFNYEILTVPNLAKSIEKYPVINRALEKADKKVAHLKLPDEINESLNEFQRINAELKTIETAAPHNPLVNSTDQWVNTSLRNALRQAVDEGADSLALASGDTVISLKMGGEPDGLRYAYDTMYPKNLRNILRKIDPEAAKPSRVETIKSHDGTRDLGQGFTVFPITDKVRESVLNDGQPMFAIGDVAKTRQNIEVTIDQIKQINEAINVVNKIAGPEVQVSFADKIPTDEVLSKKQRSELDGIFADSGVPSSVGGFYRPDVLNGKAIIGLATNDPKYDLDTTAGHEAWHHVESALASDRELALLRSTPEMERMRKVAALELDIEVADPRLAKMPAHEIRAVAFQYYRRDVKEGRQPGKGLHIGVRRFFDRMLRVFQSTVNAMNGLGFQTFEDVFGKAESGKLSKRSVRKTGAIAETSANVIPRSGLPGGSGQGNVPSAIGRMAAPWLDRLRDVTDPARVKIQDKALPIRRVAVERIERELGIKLPDSLNTYVAEALYHGRAGERLVDLREKWVEPLVEHLRETGVTFDELGDYLYARHASERNEEIRKINPDNAEGSGMSDVEAQAILSKIQAGGKQHHFDAAAEMVDGMQSETLDTLLKAGLIDRETYDNWSDRYQSYVPLRGFEMGEAESPDRPRSGRGFDVRGPESYQALGRRSKADNPASYAIMQGMQAIIRAEKNRVDKTLFRVIQAHPNEALWKVYKGEVKRRLNPTTGLVETYWAHPPFVHNDNVHGVKIGGKQYWFELKHAGLARAMRGVGVEINGTIIGRAMMKIMRGYASLLTSYNPEFVISNYFRDVQTALINVSDVAERPDHIRKKILKDATSAKAIRGVMAALYGYEGRTVFGGKRAADETAIGTKRSKSSLEYAKWFEEYRLAGGKISFLEFNDVERIKKSIQSSLDAGNFMRTTREAAKIVENMNTSVENGVRLSTYIALRKANISQDRAAFISRELTTNFNRKGEWGPAINSAYLFFNASTQGIMRMVQAMTRSKSVWYALGAIASTGIAVDVMNHLIAGEEDDDDKNAWDRIEDWKKERNMIFMIPGDPNHGYFQIPLPYGYNVPFVAGQQMMSALRGAKDPLEAAATVAGSAVEAFNPIGTSVSFWQFVSPTMLDPGIQVLENKTWYGGPIYPTKFDNRKPDSESYFSSVPPWARETAKFLNDNTGGNIARPGLIDISPEVLEHYVTFAGGGVAKFASNSIAAGARVVNDEEWIPEKTPMVRRLYNKATTSSRQREFYEAWNDIDTAHYELTKLKKAGLRDEVREVKKKYRPELRAYSVFKSARKQLKAYRKQRDAVNLNDKLASGERRKRLDKIYQHRDAVVLRALKTYRRILKEARE